MNQVFNINRWLLFTGKHWNENRKKYLLALAALAGLLIIWYSILILINPPRPLRADMQTVTYYVGLYLIGFLHASIFFSDVADTPKGIHYVMIPASIAEKLLTAIVFVVILFFVCYTLIYYGIDVIMVKIANNLPFTGWREYSQNKTHAEAVVNVFKGPNNAANPNAAMILLLLYMGLQGAFLLGSVYFARYSFIKTAIALLLIFIFFVFYLGKVMNSMMPPGSFTQTITRYKVFETGQEHIVQIPAWIGTLLEYILKYAFAPIFWLVTYFRLKEKEV